MSKVTRIAHGATIGTPIPDTKARRGDAAMIGLELQGGASLKGG